jgi:segregation and condensation protein B
MQDYKNFLKRGIEGLIFLSNKGISPEEISKLLNINEDEVLEILQSLEEEYKNRGINLYKINGKYEFGTSPDIAPLISKFLEIRREKLSKSALETLAIIAYHQPITKAEIEVLRGVKCDGVLYSLLEKGLIKVLGRKNVIGRPFIYGVTDNFYKYFLIEEEIKKNI